jgi:hypothetical protein
VPHLLWARDQTDRSFLYQHSAVAEVTQIRRADGELKTALLEDRTVRISNFLRRP